MRQADVEFEGDEPRDQDEHGRDEHAIDVVEVDVIEKDIKQAADERAGCVGAGVAQNERDFVAQHVADHAAEDAGGDAHHRCGEAGELGV